MVFYCARTYLAFNGEAVINGKSEGTIGPSLRHSYLWSLAGADRHTLGCGISKRRLADEMQPTMRCKTAINSSRLTAGAPLGPSPPPWLIK